MPIAYGTWTIQDLGEFSHFFESWLFAGPIVYIVAGCFFILSILLGILGGFKDSYILFVAIFVFLLLAFVLEMVVVTAGLILKDDFAMRMNNSMRNSITNYTEMDQAAWDNIQTKLLCCGVDSPSDWEELSTTRRAPPIHLPNSCCINLQANESCYSDDKYKVQKYGCYRALQDRMQEFIMLLTGLGVAITWQQIIGMYMTYKCAKSLRREAMGSADSDDEDSLLSSE